MADVYSAGTYITAVMQTSGFANQAVLLDELTVFIQRFGLLLYIIAAISAFIAISMSGNYRIAMYLLFGPIIFSFLIGSRSAVDGSVWRIGAGPPRTLQGVAASEDEALRAVNSSTTDDKLKAVTRANIPVAFPFRLFTSVADGIIGALTKVVLPLSDDKRDDVKNVLFISKTYALDTLLNLRLDNDVALEILNRDLMGQCNQMLDAGLALASPELGVRKEQRLTGALAAITGQNARDVQNQALSSMRATKAEKLASWEAGRELRISPSTVTTHYMAATQDVTSPESASRRWLNKNAPGTKIEQSPNMTMTCGEIWDVAADSIIRSAMEQTSSILNEFGQQLSENEKGVFCVELARRVGMPLADGDETECRQHSLVQLASIQMIRNAVRKTGYSKGIQAKKDQMNFVANQETLRAVPLDSVDQDLELVDGKYNSVPRTENHPLYGPRDMGRFRSKTTGKVESFDRPYLTQNFDVSGELTSGFVYNQQYTTRELRQGIFTLALNFPYYQGLLFYLLAAGYPFVCLVAVLPGRSGAILNYFLAWLWVRSWDFGFALILILDKILWNLFPSTDFPKEFFAGRQIGELSIPSVMEKAFADDPAYNTHAYYFILNMGLMAVPTICGYLTIKLRRSVVESLGEPLMSPMISASKERAGIAGSQYGMLQMARQTQHMKENYGAAMLSVGHQGEGLSGGEKFASANYWANLQADAKVAENIFLNPDARFDANKKQQETEMRPIYYQAAFNAMIGKEAIATAYERRLFHPVLGQMSEGAMMANAMAASFDGTGTYELYRFEEPFKEYVAALQDLTISKELIRANVNATEALLNTDLGVRIRNISTVSNPADNEAAKQAISRQFRESAVEGLLQWYDQMSDGRNRMREYYDEVEKDQAAKERARKDFESYFTELSARFSPEAAERILSMPADRSQWEFGMEAPVAPVRPVPESYWRQQK